jgi:hypothetical protein
MKKEDIFPSRYIKAADIGNREVKVTISETRMEELGEEREQKLVVYFKGNDKGLVCNVTNFDRLALICKSNDTDDWPGQTIVLHTELVTFRGQTSPSLRVKAAPPAAKQAPVPAAQDVRPEPPPEAYADEIPF